MAFNRPDPAFASTRPALEVAKLVIYPMLAEIGDIIVREPRVALEAPTGTGKSLGVPWELARRGFRVAVSVPTRQAAWSLCSRQKFLIQDSLRLQSFWLGETSRTEQEVEVGYAAEGERRYNHQTNIIYGTSGHWRRKLTGIYARHNSGKKIANRVWPDLGFCDVFILDEIHTGTVDNDILLALMTEAQKAGVRVPKLVLASATYQPEKFAGYVPIKIPTSGYPVEVIYQDDEYLVYRPEDHGHFDQTVALVAKLHGDDPRLEEGHFLVFAAGTNEVEDLAESLSDLDQVVVLPLYSKLKFEEQSRIYQAVASHQRKIVVATNIAETSLTVPGIGVVIDMCAEKRAETSSCGGFRLMTTFIAKNSADQRKGRTGRERPGKCYRVMSKERFYRLEESRPDEIKRVPIYSVILELLDAGLDPQRLLSSIPVVSDTVQSLDGDQVAPRPKIPEAKLQRTMDLLAKIKLLELPEAVEVKYLDFDSQDDSDEQEEQFDAFHLLQRQTKHARYAAAIVTHMGHFAPAFPLAVRNSAILYHWIVDGHEPYEALVILVMLDAYGPGYCFFPRKEKNESPEKYQARMTAHRDYYFSEYAGPDDLVSFARIWNMLMSDVGGLFADRQAISRYCSEWSLNHKKIREALMIMRQCVKALNDKDVRLVLRSFDALDVVDRLRPYFAEVYSDRQMQAIPNSRGTKYQSVGEYEFELMADFQTFYFLENRRKISNMTNRPPAFIMALVDFEIQTGGRILRVISVAVEWKIQDKTKGAGDGRIRDTNLYGDSSSDGSDPDSSQANSPREVDLNSFPVPLAENDPSFSPPAPTSASQIQGTSQGFLALPEGFFDDQRYGYRGQSGYRGRSGRSQRGRSQRGRSQRGRGHTRVPTRDPPRYQFPVICANLHYNGRSRASHQGGS